MEKNKFEKSMNFFKISAVFVTAVLLAVFFCLLLNGLDNYSDAAFLHSFAGKGERIFLAVLALSFFLLLYYASGAVFRRCSRKMCRRLQLVMWLCFFLAQGFFLFYIRSYYKWDSGFVIGGAASLAERGFVADEAYYYLSVYPNQNTFVVITAFLIKISDLMGVSAANRPLVLNLFNTVCMDVSVFLLYSLIKKFYADGKGDGEACRIQLFLLCNPFLHLGVSYYYTITLSWIFTVGFLYLVLMPEKQGEDQAEAKKRLSRWILAGILLGVGYELRATAVIFAIAAVFIGILDFAHSRTKNTGRHLAGKAGVIFAAALLSSQILAAGQRAYIGMDTTDTAFPASHWIMMSLTEPGGHNAEDESFTASLATKEEKEAAVQNRIREKLQDMGIGGYVRLVSVKIRRTFGDGMNGYTTFLADGYGTGGIYDLLFGEQKDFVILWHQGYYLFLITGMLFALVQTIRESFALSALSEEEYKHYRYKGLCILILFGALLFYILWEASEQYSVPFMPVMLGLAFSGDFREAGTGRQTKKGAVLVFLPAMLFLAWSIGRFSRFTGISYAQSHTAAVQILANEPMWVDDGEELIQKLTVRRPFNHLVIQWRNPLEMQNDAEYEVLLCDEGGQNVYMKEQIRAAESGYNGAGVYTFGRVNPAGNGIRDYELRIHKVSGAPDCDLQFVTYDMYGYTPYPGGRLLLYGEDKTVQEQDSSLLFLLSEEAERTYTSPKKYIFFASCLFLIFLFMGICCKIEKIGIINSDCEVSV